MDLRSAGRLNSSEKWQAVLARSVEMDGKFFFAVITTGIYCRTTCPARRPKRENAVFYDTFEEAERAGFRSCLRCKPRGQSLQQRHADIVVMACHEILSDKEDVTLRSLSRITGVSNFYFQRIFKASLGMSPKNFQIASRALKMYDQITACEKITDAIYAAGFGSNSRFYEKSDVLLGMKPESYRDKGSNHTIKFAISKIQIGYTLVASTNIGICFIDIGDHPDELMIEFRRRFEKCQVIDADDDFAKTVFFILNNLEYSEQDQMVRELPISLRKIIFRIKIWNGLNAKESVLPTSHKEIGVCLDEPIPFRTIAIIRGSVSSPPQGPYTQSVGVKIDTRAKKYQVTNNSYTYDREGWLSKSANKPA